jgi:hypothetical protein
MPAYYRHTVRAPRQLYLLILVKTACTFKERKMAARTKRNKRRIPKIKPPKKGKASFFQRKKTTSEKIFMVVGIIIAISLVLSLVVSLGGCSF